MSSKFLRENQLNNGKSNRYNINYKDILHFKNKANLKLYIYLYKEIFNLFLN